MCSTCNRAFSRKDSLARHQRQHLRRSTAPQSCTSPEPSSHGPSQHDPPRTPLVSQNPTRAVPHTPTVSTRPVDRQRDSTLMWPASEQLLQKLLSDAQHQQSSSLNASLASPISPRPVSTRTGGHAFSVGSISEDGNVQTLAEGSNGVKSQVR